MWIIGLGCTAQVGKDTAAEYLEKRYPGRVKRVAFADKLKKVCMDLFGLTYEQCYGPQEIKEKIDSRYNLTPREIMMGVGEKMRQIFPNIWVDTVFYTTISEWEKEGYDCFVISDVRYPNEGDRIHDKGGSVAKIIREGAGVTVGAGHSSETAMLDYKNFDFIIDNNGSFEDYFKKIDAMMEEINGRTSRRDVS
jgi:hypothetical protein